ncbi:MFS general substrate transporter [Lojkania enalia]|uniref:MFS general substrate transporter n=1 Tax=Lojkania enalia TaxID=147567 RepID=A0A9P4K3R7_9PLEO|nr:MFS general substrate transporter [Didymosphaeria enalia]
MPCSQENSTDDIPRQASDIEKAESGRERDISVNDWNGPDDPDNPHNWPMWLRVYHATTPGLYGFAVTFGTSVYTPALADLMHDFHISREAALIGLTVYVVGLAAGPVLTAPLSESHGRKIVYIIFGPIFMLFTLGAGFSQSFGSLIVCRFFAGLTGSPALAVGAGTNADLFPPQQRAVVTSMFLMAPFLGPALGPIVGGYAAQYKGWQWTQWCMLFITLAIYLISLPTQETYKPVILARRAQKLGIQPPNVAHNASLKTTLIQNLVRPVHMLFTEPVVFLLSLYTSFAFAILFLLFAAFPLIFQSAPYLFSVSQTGLAFLSIGLGVVLAAVTGILIDRGIYQKHFRKAVAAGCHHAAPEHRLYNMMVGGVGVTVGLFWFGWTADRGVHWVVPVLAGVPFAWGNLCLFTSAALYCVDVYGPMNGASAIAANGIFRYVLGAVFPLFTVQMYSAMGTGWATSLLGFLSAAMLPIPFVFFKWGPVIRKRSRYPTFVT